MSMLRGSEVIIIIIIYRVLSISHVDSGGARISEGFLGWGDNSVGKIHAAQARRPEFNVQNPRKKAK